MSGEKTEDMADDSLILDVCLPEQDCNTTEPGKGYMVTITCPYLESASKLILSATTLAAVTISLM